jgi:predicted DNA-binding protein
MSLVEHTTRTKSKRVVVRLKIPLHNFLEEFAQNTGRTISDVIRTSIEHYHLELFLNKNTIPTKELRRMFIEAYGDKKKRMKELKKRKINLSNF